MKPLLFLLPLLVFMSCQRSLPRQELLAYCLDPENGLYQKEEKNGAVIEAVYRPSDLVLYQQIKGQALTAEKIDSIRNYNRGLDYFLLRLSREGKEITIPYAGDQTQFSQVNNYLSFEIGKDVFVLHEGDTIKTRDFIHTRTFGSSPSSDVLFAFNSGLKNKSGNAKLIFNDQRFGLGLNEFTFSCSDIKSTPPIDLTK